MSPSGGSEASGRRGRLATRALAPDQPPHQQRFDHLPSTDVAPSILQLTEDFHTVHSLSAASAAAGIANPSLLQGMIAS